jgi:hypothetical protein
MDIARNTPMDTNTTAASMFIPHVPHPSTSSATVNGDSHILNDNIHSLKAPNQPSVSNVSPDTDKPHILPLKPVVRVSRYDIDFELSPKCLYIVNKQLVKVKLVPGTLFQADINGVLTEETLPFPIQHAP